MRIFSSIFTFSLTASILSFAKGETRQDTPEIHLYRRTKVPKACAQLQQGTIPTGPPPASLFSNLVSSDQVSSLDKYSTWSDAQRISCWKKVCNPLPSAPVTRLAPSSSPPVPNLVETSLSGTMTVTATSMTSTVSAPVTTTTIETALGLPPPSSVLSSATSTISSASSTTLSTSTIISITPSATIPPITTTLEIPLGLPPNPTPPVPSPVLPLPPGPAGTPAFTPPVLVTVSAAAQQPTLPGLAAPLPTQTVSTPISRDILIGAGSKTSRSLLFVLGHVGILLAYLFLF